MRILYFDVIYMRRACGWVRACVGACVRACVQVVASDVSPLMALHTEEK